MPLTSLLLATALAAAGQPQAPNVQAIRQLPDIKGHPVQHLEVRRQVESLVEAKGGPTCVITTMECNSTVTGTLTADDCALDDGTFADFWEFQGTINQTVTVELMSTDFDTFLFLVDPTPSVATTDNDGGNGTNSEIQHLLDQTGPWSIVANNFAPGPLGDYTLTLTCTGGGPPTSPPAAPSNLQALTLNDDEIQLDWVDNSDNEEEFRVEIEVPGQAFQDIGFVPANVTGGIVSGLDPETTYTFRVRARNTLGDSDYSNEASAATAPAGSTEACAPTTTDLCIQDDRFKVEVDWRDFSDNTGSALVALAGTADSGLFYFFDPDNWEILVKAIDGCGFNNHFWVFAAATTNVEYTLRVTDTETGMVKQYFNPLGIASPAITDTDAFATCP